MCNKQRKMTYKDFKRVVDLMIDQNKRINSLYKLGVDTYETFDEHDRIVSLLWKEVLTEFGYEWLSWYLYEKNGISGSPRKELNATDSDGSEICYNLKSTYDYIKKSGYFKSIDK